MQPGRDSADASTGFGELVGRCALMRALFADSDNLARIDTPACIYGEAGTGKNALGRALHQASARHSGPFVSVDCRASPENLEIELFGRAGGELGARAGALTLARGGTLLLDHAGDLPLRLQPRLLAALLGDREARHVRTIALHQRPLAFEVERGRFELALHRELAGRELTLPPLRERREDIPLLASHLLARIDEARGLSLSNDALAILSLHDWPGNVRELRNVLERFVYAARESDGAARRLGGLLLLGDLKPGDRRDRPSGESFGFEADASYRQQRARFEADFERRYVAWLLERHDGNLSAAARSAEMDRKYLDKLARKHGLKQRR